MDSGGGRRQNEGGLGRLKEGGGGRPRPNGLPEDPDWETVYGGDRRTKPYSDPMWWRFEVDPAGGPAGSPCAQVPWADTRATCADVRSSRAATTTASPSIRQQKLTQYADRAITRRPVPSHAYCQPARYSYPRRTGSRRSPRNDGAIPSRNPLGHDASLQSDSRHRGSGVKLGPTPDTGPQRCAGLGHGPRDNPSAVPSPTCLEYGTGRLHHRTTRRFAPGARSFASVVCSRFSHELLRGIPHLTHGGERSGPSGSSPDYS